MIRSRRDKDPLPKTVLAAIAATIALASANAIVGWGVSGVIEGSYEAFDGQSSLLLILAMAAIA
ncbi:MAG TPA: hypothetical protein VFG65_09170, partial [Fimbriimonadales bacterium]|nr:hypothetical protein [Fimbriimonadales bacterium]